VASSTSGSRIREAKTIISESASNRAQYTARLVNYNNDLRRHSTVFKLFQLVEQRIAKRLTDEAGGK